MTTIKHTQFKCCPGYSIVSGEDHIDCCITENGNDGDCQGVGLCGNAIGTCKAKISVDDPDYDQKVQDAVSSPTASQSGLILSPSSDVTTTTSSVPSSDVSEPASGSPSPSSSNSGAVGVESNAAMLAMAAALAAVPFAFY
ncbi:hypothetical protein F4811DRAFT_567643 [Daldinia bambusicola]|nr:hypothetical protein F4811DRAFT_567643 [Daldinia bambusicola]